LNGSAISGRVKKAIIDVRAAAEAMLKPFTELTLIICISWSRLTTFAFCIAVATYVAKVLVNAMIAIVTSLENDMP
jgi:hypothetical protein